jgi:hypothetical protein
MVSLLVVALGAMIGCSSEPSAKEAKKAVVLDKIVGKAQVTDESTGATDAALNAGGSSVYIWVGLRRYRLFFRTKADVVHGQHYVVEGIYAQKAIDEIGDPDQGKNGYPLQASCDQVVKMAWSKLAFDEVDTDSSLVRERVKRYPARPLFLVEQIRPATPEETAASPDLKKDDADDAKIPEIDVTADKQKALLIDGPTTQTSPMWDPSGQNVSCKVVIGPDGKIADLATGMQLCESVDWTKFSFKPTLQGGHPVKVRTEVAIRFDPKK